VAEEEKAKLFAQMMFNNMGWAWKIMVDDLYMNFLHIGWG
jgi:hypothetical protein